MEASIDWWMIQGNVEYTYSETLFSLKKEGNSAICNMDESGGHYAKWNKVGTEEHCLMPLTWGIKSRQTHTGKHWMVVARSWETGTEHGKVLFKYKVSIMEDG